jgi:NTE family protein
MLAVVLSGGGNFGALQAGALEVLLQTGIRPSLWTGTSAGGLNAIMMAANPNLDGVRSLQDHWRKARPIPESPSGLFKVAWQFVHGKEGFFPNEPVADFVGRNLPWGMETFGELFAQSGNRALTVGVEYPGGQPRIFGENAEDRLLDGAMASSAFPIFFSPWQVGESRYIDGAIFANLPVRVAVEHGADVILVIEVRGPITMIQGSGIVDVASFAIETMLAQQSTSQIEWAKHEGARIHYLFIGAGSVAGWDFSQADRLIEMGRAAAQKFLEQHGKGFPGRTTLRWRVRRLLGRGPKIHKPW